MTDPNNVFMNFFNYINDPRNEKDPSRFLSKRVLQGDSYGLETNISFQFTGGCAYGHGYIGAMFFAVIKTPGGYVYKTGNETITGSIAEEPIVQVLDFLGTFLQQIVKYNPAAKDLPELAPRVFSEPAVPTADDPEYLDRIVRKIVHADAWNNQTFGKTTSFGVFEAKALRVTISHVLGAVYSIIENRTTDESFVVIAAPHNQSIRVFILDSVEDLGEIDLTKATPTYTFPPGSYNTLLEIVKRHIV